MKHVRMVGVALGLVAGLAVAGCVSEHQQALRDMMQERLAEGINPPESPRLARMQQSASGPQLPPPVTRLPDPPRAAPPPDGNAQPVNYRPAMPPAFLAKSSASTSAPASTASPSSTTKS